MRAVNARRSGSFLHMNFSFLLASFGCLNNRRNLQKILFTDSFISIIVKTFNFAILWVKRNLYRGKTKLIKAATKHDSLIFISRR